MLLYNVISPRYTGNIEV